MIGNQKKIRPEQEERTLRIVIAGGGTGGHLFPGIAIAEAFIKRHPQSRIMFVTSGKKIEETVLSKTPYEKKIITVQGIKGKTITAKLKSILKLPKGLFESMNMLAKFKPDFVIGMGAYSAGPVLAGAWMLRINRFIHEQNSLPGITNKLLSNIADRIYVSFPETGFKESVAHKILFTGNPVRNEILGSVKNLQGKDTGSRETLFHILVLGGSQGAHSINTAVMDAVRHLKEPEKFKIIHQTGSKDVDQVRKFYQGRKIAFITEAFFEDMATYYNMADIIICRSGATTVAELSITGGTVIFIPFPYATDNHQVLNARAIVENNAAEMILENELSGKLLSERIEYFADNPETRKIMVSKIRKFGKPQAAAHIVDDIFMTVKSRSRKIANAA